MAGKISPDPVDVQVGLAVRRLRVAAGMSQSELGQTIGVAFQQVQKYERGVNRISASMMVRVAKALNVPASALLPPSEAPPPPPNLHLLSTVTGADELLAKFAAIRSAAQRRMIINLVRVLADESAGQQEPG